MCIYSTCMCIYIYIYICMYVCSKWKGVPYHVWAKMLHPEDPLPHLLEAPKTCGGGIFHVVRWNISQKFLALPPPKYSRVKGGDKMTYLISSLAMHCFGLKHMIYAHCRRKCRCDDSSNAVSGFLLWNDRMVWSINSWIVYINNASNASRAIINHPYLDGLWFLFLSSTITNHFHRVWPAKVQHYHH